MRPHRRLSIAFLLLLAFGPMAAAADTEPRASEQRGSAGPEPAGNDRGIAVFDEVVSLVQREFYDPRLGGLDWDAVASRFRPQAGSVRTADERSAVINAMLAELGASHTAHFTPSQPAYYQLLDIFRRAHRRAIRRIFPDGQVAYTGIGIFTRKIEGRTFVTGVLDGLPAARVGLAAGDEIVAVDGRPFHPVESFRDRSGATVTLTVRRTRSGAPEGIRVVPERIRPNDAFLEAMEASARVIEKDGVRIGYVRVWSYAGWRYQELLQQLLATGPLHDADALVWDLRDGWGGAQPEYLDIFNRRGPTLTLTGREGDASIDNFKWRKPVAVLVNGGTRSGKEILTDGFKRYRLGEVVGTRTEGAVLAARTFLLSDDSLLLLAVTDVSVDGRRLEAVGVTPTVEVPFALEYAQGADPQRDRAVELLARSLGRRAREAPAPDTHAPGVSGPE